MRWFSAKIVFLALVGVGCNDYMSSFSTEFVELQPGAELPPTPVDAEGAITHNDDTRVITDEELEELNIPPESIVAGLTRKFMANPLHRAELTTDFQTVVVDNMLTMTAEMVDESREFTQITRPVYTVSFHQTGTYGDKVEETFSQNERGILDILMVIDNSKSMQPAQENVSQRLTELLNYVSGSSWRIAITSTDRRDCIRRVITSETPDYERVFVETIMGLGIEGSPAEEAILMAHRGLQGECKGRKSPWLREGSSLAIIIVTDEDHQCYKSITYDKRRDRFKREKCYSRRDSKAKQLAALYKPIDDFYAYLRRIRQPGVTAKLYGIVSPLDRHDDRSWLDGGSQRFRNWRSSDGRELFSSVADIFSNEEDYDSILQDISADISVILEDKFLLKKLPTAGTISVQVSSNGRSRVLHADEYMVRGKTLTLNTAPPEGATIKVRYHHGAKPDIKHFVLPQLPLPGSVVVKASVNGQTTTIDPSDYLRVGRDITFSRAPPKGASVTVFYKENRPLRNSLQLGEGRITKLIVTIDGYEVYNYMLDTQTNLLVFDDYALPAEGTLVKAVYNAIVEENLSYPLARHAAVRSEDGLICFSADDPMLTLSCDWQELGGKDYVVFARGEFVPGRVLVVRQMLDIDANNISLQENYLADSIQLKFGTAVCQIEQLVIEGNTIMLDTQEAQATCPYLRDNTEPLLLSYSYIELRQTFTIETAFFDAHSHEYEHWSIKVNGEKVKDFEIKDHTVHFGYQLPPDSVVEVKVALY